MQTGLTNRVRPPGLDTLTAAEDVPDKQGNPQSTIHGMILQEGRDLAGQIDVLSRDLLPRMQSVETAKAEISRMKDTLEGIEVMLREPGAGKNEQQRRDAHWIACHDNPEWLAAHGRLEATQQRLAEAQVELNYSLERLGALRSLLRFYTAALAVNGEETAI